MLKYVTLLSLILFSVNIFAQISFEKGYFINNQNEKIECFIKNVDWKNNPTKFKYKLTENAPPQTASVEAVKEFGIDDSSKYLGVKIDIDRSSNNVETMDNNREPNFKSEELFLKVLVEGDATLLLYRERKLSRYFIKTTSGKIEQLVFKRYKSSSDKVSENKEYLIQLRDHLKCEMITSKRLTKVKYEKKPLVKLFVDYHKCLNIPFSDYGNLKTKGQFHLSIKPGIQYSILKTGGSVTRESEFDDQIGFRLGIELEYILPFNKNKWAFLIEPTYQSYQSNGTLNNLVLGTNNVAIDYKSIELPIGIKHYFYLNSQSKLFLNAFYVLDFPLKSQMTYENGGPPLELRSYQNFAVGLGFYFREKFSAEVRHGIGRTIYFNPVAIEGSYRTFSIVLGYRIL